MRPDLLSVRLHDAKVEAEQDRIRILKQKVTIAALRAMGVNATEAEQNLLIFERIQDIHLAEIERIKDALTKMHANVSEGIDQPP